MRIPFILIAAACSLLGLRSQAQVEASHLHFQTPENWRSEVIQLPPGFAPDLKWHGFESIRFAPGMFRPDAESFFSYVLVFILAADDDIGDEAIHSQVLTYYRGLARAVMTGKATPPKTEDFQLELKKEDAAKAAGPARNEMKFWSGRLQWIEPFATQKPQTLHLELLQWKEGTRPVLYFAVSPQATDHAIWKEMRDYRAKFEISRR